MILGIGCDIVQISRIQNIYNVYHSRFLNKYFRGVEVTSVANMQQEKVAYFLSNRFAAKEACSKALGTGFSVGVIPKDIEVRSHKSGKPFIVLHGKVASIVREYGYKQVNIHLSLSHEKEYSIAHVVIEGIS